MEMVKEAGYQLDPMVSGGMSKIRQRQFFRETLAWCSDKPRASTPWFEPMFQAAEDYGMRLGYKIEPFHFEKAHPTSFRRLVSVWKARGIRGVLLGPFRSTQESLAMPWDDFAWVVIGRPFDHPALHSVGRDFQADIQIALNWLRDKDCRRVCFLLDTETVYPFQGPLHLSSLVHYNGVRAKPQTPCFKPNPSRPQEFRSWMEKNRPDGLILPHKPQNRLGRMVQPLLDTLPSVYLTLTEGLKRPNQACFRTRFEVMGQSSVNLLHRLLTNRELGIPSYKQSILIDSQFMKMKTLSVASDG